MDLSLATTDEIWGELKTRFKNVLVVTLAAAGNGDENTEDDIRVTWAGGNVAALGLTRIADAFLKQLIMNAVEEDE